MSTAVVTPMSPELHARCALAVLASAVLACGMGLLAWGPIAAGQYAHALAEVASEGWAASPSMGWFFVPGLVAAAYGWQRASNRSHRMWREAWRAFFTMAALALLAAAADHVLPSAGGQLMSRIASASACALVSLLFIAERLGRSWIARRAVVAALIAGPIAGAICWMTQNIHGMPDVRPLMWLESLPFLMVPLGVWGLRSRGLAGRDWLVALGLLSIAEALGWACLALPESLALTNVGVALHHLAQSAVLGWLAWSLGHQKARDRETPLSERAGEAAGISSQRSTSRVTSGW